MTSLRDHIRHNILGCVALFIALCGTAYAGTIGSSDVIDNSLKSVDLKNGAGVKTQDVIDDSLTGADIDQSTLGKVPDTEAVGGLTISDLVFTEGNPGFEGDFGGTFDDLYLLEGLEDTSYGIASTAIKDSTILRSDMTDGAAGAYGVIDDDGDLRRSSNVASVTHPDEGAFCITPNDGIDATERGLVASPNYATDQTSTGSEKTNTVEWDSARPDCPSGSLEVRTFLQFPVVDLDGDVAYDMGNFQHDAGFSFIIP